MEQPDSQDRKNELLKLEENQKSFLAMFDEVSHNKQVEMGSKSLSFKATQAALLIFVYQDEPILQMPFTILQSLIDIDELLVSWRYRHALVRIFFSFSLMW
jgi:tryptophan 2,3-dioxygenase